MNDHEKIAEMNKILQESLSIEPLIEFQEPLSTASAEMRYGLAMLYSNEGVRKYLTNAYLEAVKNTAVKSTSLVDIAAGKMRALTIKEILIKARLSFMELEKLQKNSKRGATITVNQEINDN